MTELVEQFEASEASEASETMVELLALEESEHDSLDNDALDHALVTLDNQRINSRLDSRTILNLVGNPPLPSVGTWQRSHHIEYWLRQISSLIKEISEDIPYWHGLPLRSLATRLDKASKLLKEPVPYPTMDVETGTLGQDKRKEDRRRASLIPKVVYNDEDRVKLLRFIIEQRSDGVSYHGIARKLDDLAIYPAGTKRSWNGIRLRAWYYSAKSEYMDDIAPDLELMKEHLKEPATVARKATQKAVQKSRRKIIEKHKKRMKLKVTYLRMTDWQKKWSRRKKKRIQRQEKRATNLDQLKKKGLPLNERWRRDKIKLTEMHDALVRRDDIVKIGTPALSTFKAWMRGTRAGWKQPHIVAMAEIATLLSYSGTVYTAIEVGMFLRAVKPKSKTDTESTHTPEQVQRILNGYKGSKTSYEEIARRLNDKGVSVKYGTRVLRVWRASRVKQLMTAPKQDSHETNT